MFISRNIGEAQISGRREGDVDLPTNGDVVAVPL